MTTPPASGVALIKEFEGCHEPLSEGFYTVFAPYLCPAGVWTIGWGSTKTEDGHIVTQWTKHHTQQQCDALLERDTWGGMTILETTIPYWQEMSDDQRGALLSFGYNLGWHFYGASGFDTITRGLKEKDWAAVPDALMLYVKGGGQTMPGLVRRREAEGALWTQGMNAQPPAPPMESGTSFDPDFLNTYKYWTADPH